VASGPNLVRFDSSELKGLNPFIWQQSEYMTGGDAGHISLMFPEDLLLSKTDA
jgi:hypothetical protein